MDKPNEGSRWTRPKYNPQLGPYNGYTVLCITNTKPNAALFRKNFICHVVYQGDNGHFWSIPLSEWPLNLIPEETEELKNGQ